MVVGGFRRPEGTGFLGKRLEGLVPRNLNSLNSILDTRHGTLKIPY